MSQPPTSPANAYLQRQLEQASPTQAVLLLLDGAIKFTLQAKDAILRRDIQARYNANRRTVEIITFLLSQQDERQGEAAVRLIRIFGGLLTQLLKIDFDNDPALCDAVVANLRQLRQGFASLQPASNVVAAPGSTAAAPSTPPKLAASA
ncbi:MAG: flagellar protein FliS [Alphaproteobacteria bacterium]|jgi:flagellar biosynthetic protein FliS|nr:flagellar protein FliS [Alphaproteobacteria bacterium]